MYRGTNSLALFSRNYFLIGTLFYALISQKIRPNTQFKAPCVKFGINLYTKKITKIPNSYHLLTKTAVTKIYRTIFSPKEQTEKKKKNQGTASVFIHINDSLMTVKEKKKLTKYGQMRQRIRNSACLEGPIFI